MDKPRSEGQMTEIGEKNMSTAQDAMTKVREGLYRRLSIEQQNMLPGSKLKVETITASDVARSTSEQITGEITIEGENHLIEMARSSLGTTAKIDDISFEGQNAASLWEFYYPIAKITTESEYYPTADSQEVLKKTLLDKALGK